MWNFSDLHIAHDPSAPAAPAITFDDFLKVDIRAGTIVAAEPFPGARHPSSIVRIDFGTGIGQRKSVARITERHAVESLPGRRVMAVVNFPPRQIGPHRSEVLLLGFADAEGAIILPEPAAAIPDGARLA